MVIGSLLTVASLVTIKTSHYQAPAIITKLIG